MIVHILQTTCAAIHIHEGAYCNAHPIHGHYRSNTEDKTFSLWVGLAPATPSLLSTSFPSRLLLRLWLLHVGIQFSILGQWC